MQRQPFYITRNGTLSRNQNTLLFENEAMRKVLPIHAIESLYCTGEISLNSKLLTFLAKQGIPIHFFNYYGYYTGTFYPKETLVSGSLIVKQVEHYANQERRLFLAKAFVNGTLKNLIRILEHHRKHARNVSETMSHLSGLLPRIDACTSIPELMSIEGAAWNTYYASFDEIITGDFTFGQRTRRPPQNEINCLISFLNSLLYAATLSELYHTQLHPAISYLHEPFERRFSLALDISEMFKPLIVQRALLKLINKGEIQEKHFRRELNGCLLNDEGRLIVLKEFDVRLKLAVDHPTLKRPVSYRRLIRLEGYRLIKPLLGDKEYQSFVI